MSLHYISVELKLYETLVNDKGPLTHTFIHSKCLKKKKKMCINLVVRPALEIFLFPLFQPVSQIWVGLSEKMLFLISQILPLNFIAANFCNTNNVKLNYAIQE